MKPEQMPRLSLLIPSILIMICYLALESTSAVAQHDVQVRITADNAYGFGYGSPTEMKSYFGGLEAFDAREIFSCNPRIGAEEYTVPSTSIDDYLYIIAWSDKQTTQGVLGQFKSGDRTIYTGLGDWEVYATGVNYRVSFRPNPGPPLSEINDQINIANQSMGNPSTSSQTWVDASGIQGTGRLEFGETNDDDQGRGDFPAMQCIDSRARWMWYNSDPTVFSNAFRGGPVPEGHHEFLIFRLPIRSVIPSITPSPTSTDTPSPTPSLTSTWIPTNTSTPSPSSTPSSTPTATSTPTPTLVALPVFLPLILKESCPPKDIFVDVVVVLDASSSMRKRDASGKPRLEAAKEAILSFAGGLRRKDRFALVTFNDTAQLRMPLGSNMNRLKVSLDSVEIMQHSRIDLGISLAASELVLFPRQNGVPILIIVSDGIPSQVTEARVLTEAQEAKNAGVTIISVGTGEAMNRDVLREIASRPSEFYDAEDIRLIKEVFDILVRTAPCQPSLYWAQR